MNTPKLRIVLFAISAVVVGFVLGISFSVRSETVEVAQLNRMPANPELKSRIAELEEKLLKAETRAEQAEKDTGTLLKAIEASRTERAAHAAAEQARGLSLRAQQQDLGKRSTPTW